MKVSILSNGKITTTQYSNVSVDGKVEAMGGGGIEAETDPIFSTWRTETGDKLVTDVSTLSGEVAIVASELDGKADKSEIPEIPDLSGYATTDSVTAGLATKADTADVYTKAEVDSAVAAKANVSDVYTKGQVDEALDDKADKSAVDGNTADITALGNSITLLNESITVLGSDKADKTAVDANTACITALNNSITTLGCDLSSLDSTVGCLSCTVSVLGCDLINKISYDDLCFCSTGYDSNYITVQGITVGIMEVDSIWYRNCDSCINIPRITTCTITAYDNYLDLYSSGAEVYIYNGGVSINSQCTTTIDSPYFRVQYCCVCPLTISSYCNSPSIDIRSHYVCIDSTKVSIDSDISLIGCHNCASWNTGEARIVRWIEASDGCAGYIPVFNVIGN